MIRAITASVVILCVCGPLAAEAPLDRTKPVPLTEDVRQKSLKVLRDALDSPEWWPAMHAAEALTQAGFGEEVLKSLAKRTPADDQQRCGLIRETVRAGDRRPLPKMFEILGDKKSIGRVHAAESLYKISEVDDGVLLRAAMAETGNVKLSLMAAAALARCGHPDALARIRERLSDELFDNRMIAAWALALLGDQSDIPALTAMAGRETDAMAKAYAIYALACLDDAAGRQGLRANLASADVAVRTYAADFASYARAVEETETLKKQLDDEGLDSRVRAAQALLNLAKPAAALGLPVAARAGNFAVDVYPASQENPRYSEGSVALLRDSTLLYATTEFIGSGDDFAKARIIARRSQDGGRTWSDPEVLQENVGKTNVMSVTLRRLAAGDAAPLGMFYLIKNTPSDLKVWLRVSTDETKTWGEPVLVTDQPGYHVLNNDRITLLSSGRLVCPVATADDVFKKGHFVSQCFLSDDQGATWRVSANQVDAPQRGAMEPEVVELESNDLLMIVRTQMGHIATSRSTDGGQHWSAPDKLSVAAPEAPATIRRIPASGDLLLVWNNTFEKGVGHGGRRTPLTSAISRDQGKTWMAVKNLETRPDETYAYTSVLFVKDRVLLTYYVEDTQAQRYSSRFRSIPIRDLYQGDAPPK